MNDVWDMNGDGLSIKYDKYSKDGVERHKSCVLDSVLLLSEYGKMIVGSGIESGRSAWKLNGMFQCLEI